MNGPVLHGCRKAAAHQADPEHLRRPPAFVLVGNEGSPTLHRNPTTVDRVLLGSAQNLVGHGRADHRICVRNLRQDQRTRADTEQHKANRPALRSSRSRPAHRCPLPRSVEFVSAPSERLRHKKGPFLRSLVPPPGKSRIGARAAGRDRLQSSDGERPAKTERTHRCAPRPFDPSRVSEGSSRASCPLTAARPGKLASRRRGR
jgi:hypothetical protein